MGTYSPKRLFCSTHHFAISMFNAMPNLMTGYKKGVALTQGIRTISIKTFE